MQSRRATVSICFTERTGAVSDLNGGRGKKQWVLKHSTPFPTNASRKTPRERTASAETCEKQYVFEHSMPKPSTPSAI